MARALASRRRLLTDPPPPTGYTAAQAARLTGCTEAQLRYWRRSRLLTPKDRRYSFRDLVALRVVVALLESGLPLARIRRALSYLVESGEDVAGLRLVTDGDTVWACRDDGQILDALRHGQLALFVAVDAMAEDVEAEVRAFDAERRAFVNGLRAQDQAPSDEAASGRAGGESST
jgi:DNA-binding transcriptional MerR regulator